MGQRAARVQAAAGQGHHRYGHPTWSTTGRATSAGHAHSGARATTAGGHPNRTPWGTLERRTPPSPARSEVAMGAVGGGVDTGVQVQAKGRSLVRYAFHTHPPAPCGHTAGRSSGGPARWRLPGASRQADTARQRRPVSLPNQVAARLWGGLTMAWLPPSGPHIGLGVSRHHHRTGNVTYGEWGAARFASDRRDGSTS
jgi:hypothetical protein